MRTENRPFLAVVSNQKKKAPPSQDTPAPMAFLRDMLHHPDANDGASIVEQHAGLTFDRDHPELHSLRIEVAELKGRFERSTVVLLHLEAKRNGTKRVRKLVSDQSFENGKRAFRTWLRLDQVQFALFHVASIGCLTMGTATVFANLMASGQPVFIERPWLAMCLSALPSCGSIALKAVLPLFESARAKHFYKCVIFGLTGLALLTWTFTFAANFTGITPDIDSENVLTTSAAGASLVFSQLIAELLIAGSLFLAADEIASKYTHYDYAQDGEFFQSDSAVNAHLVDHDLLKAPYLLKTGQLDALLAARQVFIDEQMAAYRALQARIEFQRGL